MWSPSRPFFLSVWAVLLLVVIIGGGIASNFAAKKLNEDDALVRHTYQVLRTLDHALSSLQDAETGQRGFLITGRIEYLDPYNAGVAHVQNDLVRLRALTADNPEHQRRLAQLGPLVDAKLQELKQTIALRSEAGPEAARTTERMNRGKETMDAIRRNVAAFALREGGLLESRAYARDRASKALSLSLFMSSVAAVVLFLLTVGQVNRRLEAELVAREEAERAAQIKDEFIATVSHELRTPLTSILGWIQILRAKNLDSQTEREALAMIERGARAQTHLVDDLLEMARISSGKMRLDIRPFVLPEVVIGAVESIRPAAEAKRIRLTQAIDPNAGPVSGDPDRVQQIVWNLLSNAIKFTDKEGSVHVAVQRINSHVEIVVRDTGDGIDPEFLPYVFERFRQADSVHKTKNKGLGLGLAIVRQLTELQGGTVHVFSGGKGTGATFTVALPVAGMTASQDGQHRSAHGASTAENAPHTVSWPDLHGISVLVVDDHEETLTMLQTTLERAGATVATAGSVAEAMAAFERNTPDVVVSDIGMPGEDGYALVVQIRTRPADRGGRTPVIAVTALARTEERLEVLSRGFQGHLGKPIEPMELALLVANLTHRRDLPAWQPSA